MSLDVPILKKSIRDSETEKNLKNEVESQLKLAEYILRWAKDKYWKWSEIYDKIKNEQNELKQAIKNSLKNDNETTQDEMFKLKLEIWDILNIANKEKIREKAWLFSNKLWDKYTWVDRNKAENNSNNVINKSIDDIKNHNQLLILLEHSNKEYCDLNESIINSTALEYSELFSKTSSYSDIDNTAEANMFQDYIIEKLLWENHQWYNENYIVWYNEQKWNFLTTITDFEKELKTWNINDVDSMWLRHYLLYLQENNNLNTEILVKKLGTENINVLKSLWNNDKSSNTLNLLSEYWLKDIVKKIISIDITNTFKQLENLKVTINYNNLDNSFLLANKKKLIPLITNKRKLLSLLGKNNENNIDITLINKNLLLFPEISSIVKVWFSEIKDMPNNKLKDRDLLKVLLHKDDWVLFNIIIQKLEKQIKSDDSLKEFIQDIVKQKKITNINVEMSSYSNYILYDRAYNITNNSKLIVEINNFINSNETNKSVEYINDYLSNYWINGNEDLIIDYIKHGWAPTSEIMINITDIRIAEILIEKYWIGYIPLLPDNLYIKNPSLLIKVLSIIDASMLYSYINILPLNNIENFIYYTEAIEKNIVNDNKKNEIYNDPLYSSKLLRLLENKTNILIPDKYIKYFNIIKNNIRIKDLEIKNDLETIWEIKKSINEKIAGMDFEEKKKNIINNLPKAIEKLNINGLEFSNNDSQLIMDYFISDEKWDKNLALTIIKEKCKNNSENTWKVLGLFLDNALYITSEKLQNNINQAKQIDSNFDDDKLIEWFTEFLWSDWFELAIVNDQYIDQYLNKIWTKIENRKNLTQIIRNRVDFTNIKILKQKTCTEEWIKKILDKWIDWTSKKELIASLQSSSNQNILQEYNIDNRLEEIFYQEYIDYKKNIEENDDDDDKKQTEDIPTIGNEKNNTNSHFLWEYNHYSLNKNNNTLVSKLDWIPINITKDEADLIQQNPEAINNILNLKNKLSDCNLSMFWDINIRTKIFWTITQLWFNIKDDYLKPNEIKIYLGTILKSISDELWENIPSQNLSIDEYIQKVKVLNKSGSLWWIQDVNELWESHIEKIFTDKFIPRNSSLSNLNTEDFFQEIS
jgi:hypothetical protein